MSAATISTTQASAEAQLTQEATQALALASGLGAVLDGVEPHLTLDAQALLEATRAAAAQEAIFTETFLRDLAELQGLLRAAIAATSRRVDLQSGIVLPTGEPASPYWSTQPTPTSQALTDRLRYVESLAASVARTRHLAAGLRAVRALLDG